MSITTRDDARKECVAIALAHGERPRDFVVIESAPELWNIYLGGNSIAIHATRAYLSKPMDWYSRAILVPAVLSLLSFDRMETPYQAVPRDIDSLPYQ